MNDKISNISGMILGLLMVIFGLNKFLGFIPVEPPDDVTAQTFLGAMFTTYLFKVVAVAEILGGILLCIPRYAFVGMTLLAPVIFNIIAFHIAHDLPGNGLWLMPSLLFGALVYFFYDKIKNIIQS